MSNSIQQAADRFLVLTTRLRRLRADTPPPQAAQVSPSLMVILEYVATSPDCGVKEIAHALKLSMPTVSVSVRQLEEAGFVGRRPHPRDKRAVQIFLTPAGRDLYERTHAFRRQMFEKLLAALPSEERDTLLYLLEKALDYAESEADSGSNS